MIFENPSIIRIIYRFLFRFEFVDKSELPSRSWTFLASVVLKIILKKKKKWI